ncbi:hypothetical protein B0I27_10490 [Arcticibacter pallidicorallinus]|uniref:Uncharacterized protein n=1 Tax=Arcticibacter pallidicorallinus TaxID=1259464 RepID=A0A2T0U5B2_9SPHI|nr:hypothetical protein B0I27_10490 [Arcticibacter pallidicorallinus]
MTHKRLLHLPNTCLNIFAIYKEKMDNNVLLRFKDPLQKTTANN